MTYKIKILLLNVLFLLSFKIFAQEKAALNDADIKKIEKAEKELLKSEAKYKEADKIYSDVSNRQSELTAEESDKLNNKAMSKQIESIKIEFNAKSVKYEVYATHVELFWVKNPSYIESMRYAHSLDNDAKNDYSTAKDLFKEQESISDNLIRLGKISDAKDNMQKALDKMKQAFDLCANPNLAENSTPPMPEESKKDSLPTSSETQASQTQDTTSTISSNSLSTSALNADTVQLPKEEPFNETADNKSTAQTTSPTEEKLPETSQAVDNEKTKDIITTENPASGNEVNVQKEIFENQENQSLKTEKEYTSAQTAEVGTIYKVQIAASRVPLKAEQLAEIYNGSENPEEELLNEWYKYTIGNFSTYEEAAQMRDNCGVKGAFVVKR